MRGAVGSGTALSAPPSELSPLVGTFGSKAVISSWMGRVTSSCYFYLRVPLSGDNLRRVVTTRHVQSRHREEPLGVPSHVAHHLGIGISERTGVRRLPLRACRLSGPDKPMHPAGTGKQ